MDIWKDACDSLVPSLQHSLDEVLGKQREQQSDTATPHQRQQQLLTTILKQAEEKRKLSLHKRWKVDIHGKSIVIRDVFEKIITWVNRFKTLHPPSLTVHLPWAGVSSLIVVALTDKQCFEYTVDGLEVVSHYIVCYAAFEPTYLLPGLPFQSELQSAVTNLYTLILNFLANGVNFFEQSASDRIRKCHFQDSQREVIEKIRQADAEAMELATKVHSDAQWGMMPGVHERYRVLKSLQHPIRRLLDVSTVHAKIFEEEDLHRINQWLLSPFTNNPEYLAWKEFSCSSVLLLHGIPESGKTFLVSAVIDSFLEEMSINSPSAPLAYYYCGDSRLGRAWADPEDVLRSLTRQLAIVDTASFTVHGQVPLEYRRKEAEARLDGFELPSLGGRECTDLILNILGTNSAVMVVDGVDEIENSRRHELIDALDRIRRESASVVKIFISSRDNSWILAGMPDALLLGTQEVNTRFGMETYISQRVIHATRTKYLLNGIYVDNLREKSINFSRRSADGTFLSINLRFEAICKLQSMASVEQAIESLPEVSRTIDSLYSDILNRIRCENPQAYDVATRVFSWLLCMYEPLSPSAIMKAISTYFPGNFQFLLPNLLKTCSNLVVHDKKIAHDCLSVCARNLPLNVGPVEQPARNFPLYAAMYWPRHVEAALEVEQSPSSDLRRELRSFVFKADGRLGIKFEQWLQTAQQVADFVPANHPLKMNLGQ
ncbi:uncharacterized protein BO88DRAFT_454581 [Aspergillus vadensis CBS 113365]|uniref:Nephrocystin 3-like N-terminal domain-containing protein n=1 Tax=Aspergillus vadensis (strain CBS 113365 / IMI 142717 / IBT 24658) TaxID=1448311 RepID=A0A319CJ32_ASPVC|nr:hypothetical protein BO88DRAFT_454581 [Aspergillus vadensis CBS 113365]PYH68292.1 hypothetical protein BO88DRAFT_454581 [Aspergillus vadensis CBS 113365]